MYIFNRITVNPQLPKRIEKLSEISNNLWWSWNTEFLRLFQKIDRDLWEQSNKNPIKFLKQIERMVKIEEPNKYDLRTFHANFNIQESGKEVLTVKKLKIGYDEVLQEINFTLYRGEKLRNNRKKWNWKIYIIKNINRKDTKLRRRFSVWL